jgi:small subunit ribosomal protein S19e
MTNREVTNNMGIYDVDATLLIHRTADELKKIETITPPSWSNYVKTGMSKEKPPTQPDWWYIRSAAILRKLMVFGPVGTEKLRTKFGSKKNRGVRPEKFFPGAGNHIRKILQQLEKAGLAAQAQKATHKGRVVTPAGHKLLASVATTIMKEQGITLASKPAPKPKKKAAKKEAPVKEAPKAEEKVEAPVEEKKEEAPVEKTEEVQEAPAEEEKQEDSQ